MDVNKEREEIHDQKVMMPITKKELTLEQRKSPLYT